MRKHFLTALVIVQMLLLPLTAAPVSASAGEGAFYWVTLLPFYHTLEGLEHDSEKIADFSNINADAVSHALLISVILIALALYLKFKAPRQIIPSEKPSLSNIVEAVIEFVYGLLEENIGSAGRRFIPIIGSLFVFILVGNLIGLLPGFLPPTENININAGCALIVFFAYQGIGFKEHGVSYLKHFCGPIWWLAPFMFIIEMIGHVARPFSLSIRLFGNIMGDHKVLEIFSNLVPIGVPVFNLALGTFVSVIQALVFSLLSIIYISLALDAGEH
jgi:F-type H+-transporting ATPase subunit a